MQTGSSLKLSTGTLLWNGGSRVPRHDEGPVSLYSLLFGRHPDEPTKPISTAPSGVRRPPCVSAFQPFACMSAEACLDASDFNHRRTPCLVPLQAGDILAPSRW